MKRRIQEAALSCCCVVLTVFYWRYIIITEETRILKLNVTNTDRKVAGNLKILKKIEDFVNVRPVGCVKTEEIMGGEIQLNYHF